MDLSKLMDNLRRAAACAPQDEQQGIEWMWEALARISSDPALFDKLLELHKTAEWPAAAVPVPGKPADQIHDVNSKAGLTCAGVDGSQVYADADSTVLWAYVQAAAVGEGLVDEWSEEFFQPDRLLDDNGYPHPRGYVDSQRMYHEISLASRVAQQWQGLVILDGSLLPWMGMAASTAQATARHVLALERCQGQMICSVVSQPQSRFLINLVGLVTRDGETFVNVNARDLHLVGSVLKVGQRTAVFEHGSPLNKSVKAHGAAVYFFFMRLPRGEIVRVEIPEWVAVDDNATNAVQASVYKNSLALGYPVVLAAAHEKVVISLETARRLREEAEKLHAQMTGQVNLRRRKDEIKW